MVTEGLKEHRKSKKREKKERLSKEPKRPKVPKTPKDLNQSKDKAAYSKGIASVSFLIAVFDKFWDIFCKCLVKGFFGTICSGYTKLQLSFENGFLREFIFKDRRLKKIFRKCRKFLSQNIETCFIVTKGQRMIKYFASAPLSFYGNFGLFFGFYTSVVYFVKLLMPGISAPAIDHLIVGVAAIVISFPLVFSRISFSSAIIRSSIGRFVFQKCFFFSDEVILKYSSARKGKGNLMLFFGLVAGTITFFVHPLYIIAVIALFTAVAFVAVRPEIGVILTVFAVPFCIFAPNPTITLCAFVLTTTFFYFIKIIRGKRVFKVELIDAAIILFGFLIYFSSVFSAGYENSRNAALVSCTLLFGYFLLVNLMRTEKWIKRCVSSFVSSAVIVAVIGVFEYLFGEGSNASWLDQSLFGNIKLRIVSLFENPNMLATYLVLAFPFLLAYFANAKKKNEKFFYFILSVILVSATVLTWSRGAWIALAVAALIFFTVYTRKTLRIFGVLLLAAPVLPMVMPNTILDRLLSIVNLSDSSISYRMYTWIGTIRAIKDNFLGGIGWGQEAFANIYPQYSYAGMETAEHTHSLYLQLLFAMGIGGLITFLILIFLYFQKCSEYIKNPENLESKFFVSAAITSIIATLIMGAFDYIWFNYRVFYVFWMVVAIGCAFVRVGNAESERSYLSIDEHSTYDDSKI
jgi:O-antigen ligase